MPTHAELASKLLTDAAGFFRTLAEQNPDVGAQMVENANVFDQISGLLLSDPNGSMNEIPYSQFAGRLLQDAAEFFLSLAEQNEPIREQMMENANVFRQLGELVMQDPNGILD